jgi:hypothetical protein
MKEEFAGRLGALRQAHPATDFEFTPPTYDEEFRAAIAKLDATE